MPGRTQRQRPAEACAPLYLDAVGSGVRPHRGQRQRGLVFGRPPGIDRRHREPDGRDGLDHIEYDAFGNVTLETNAANGDWVALYRRPAGPGHRPGLILFGERWYNPATDVWTSATRPVSAAATTTSAATSATGRTMGSTRRDSMSPFTLHRWPAGTTMSRWLCMNADTDVLGTMRQVLAATRTCPVEGSAR